MNLKTTVVKQHSIRSVLYSTTSSCKSNTGLCFFQMVLDRLVSEEQSCLMVIGEGSSIYLPLKCMSDALPLIIVLSLHRMCSRFKTEILWSLWAARAHTNSPNMHSTTAHHLHGASWQLLMMIDSTLSFTCEQHNLPLEDKFIQSVPHVINVLCRCH